VSKAAESGKVTKIDDDGCQIQNSKQEVIARATRLGSLYYLDCKADPQANMVQQDVKVSIWHRRYGHLGVQNLQKLARDSLVRGYDYNPSKGEIDFCEAFISGKLKKTPFQVSERRAERPLDLVHSDVCGKINNRSLGGAEYFLTFIDDSTHYAWIYVLKHKDEVFKCFQQWKILVEKANANMLKVLRTDNGGEYTSKMFEEFLRSEGIRHERTIPKTPEQNGVAERMN